MANTKARETITFRTETIAPERAAVLLAKQRNFRRLMPSIVARYARAITEGRWEENAETIKIDRDGFLVDGQHRLSACVQAGKPIRVAVAYGVDETVHVDTGKHRSTAQYVEMLGHDYSGHIAAAARLIYLYDGVGLYHLTRASSTPDNEEIATVLERHPGLPQSVQISQPAAFLIQRSILGFIHCIASEELGDRSLPDLFVSSLASGDGLTVGDPILVFRDRLIRDKAKRMRLQRLDRVWMAIRIWNDWIRGVRRTKMQGIRYKDGVSWAEREPDMRILGK